MRAWTMAVAALLSVSCGESGGSTSSLLEEYILSDDELVPESGDFDETNRAFYVGSVTKGIVTRVNADGTETVVYTPPPGKVWRLLGVEINTEDRLLWACANSVEDTLYQLWVIDLETNTRTAVLDLPESVDSPECNDIALDSAGLAYVTDSSNPNIYRADLDAEEVVIWSSSEVFPDAGEFGLNGIAITSDEAYLLASRTLPGTLYRIDMSEPSSGIVVDTPIFPGENADGMSMLDGVLYLSFTSAVRRFTTDDDWASASSETTEAPAGTSTVIAAEERAYAVYSDILNALFMRDLNPPFRIFRVDNATYE